MKTGTIAVSGGSKGIGRAIAETFAAQGWAVAVVARSSSEWEAMQAVWRARFPDAPLYTCVADVSTPEGCQTWIRAVSDVFPALDVLVHNAGAFAPGTLLTGDDEQLSHFLSTNLLSAHQLTRGLLPHLEASPRGRVITIGSVATTDWPPPMAAYALSKYALEGWHRAIAPELAAAGIRMTLIRPGATFTHSWAGVPVDPNTLLHPEQVAQWVLRAATASDGETLEEICVRPV